MDAYCDDARILDNIASDLVWADWPRAKNRALILGLANGEPTFTKSEAASAKIKTNLNDLTHCTLLHEARTQYANGIFQTGQYISVRTDWSMGQPEKVDIWSGILEKEINSVLVESLPYYELLRAKFGLAVLHGCAPSYWKDSYSLIPKPMGVGDLLIPNNIELGFDGLEFFPLRKSLTAKQLAELTMASKRDPGWNMPLVESCLAWVRSQMEHGLQNDNYQYFRPEKWQEDRKQQGPGWYMNDTVPTIDVFDFYCYQQPTSRKPGGWVRRMILDSWSNPGNPPTGNGPQRVDRKGLDKKLDKKLKGDLLFQSMEPVADSWQNILTVQYADLSAGFPAMHNSQRSLGWLGYALCLVQNRMKCRVIDSTFEALLQYFRVKNMDGVQRALKVELASQGFIDETIEFVKQQDRWQPNAQFVELGMGIVKSDLDAHSKSFTATPDANNARTEKTKFQYMAEVQRVNSLASAGLSQFYRYQESEDREIVRRALRPASKDPMVRRIRENCLRQGVPEKLLNCPDAWHVQHERMMGQGNQTLELMISEAILKLAETGIMAPDKVQIAARNYVTALTHNPQMALEYFPVQQNKNPDAAQKARNDFSTCLDGIEVPPVSADINAVQYTAAFTVELYKMCKGIEKSGGMTDQKTLKGLANAAQTAKANIGVLAKGKVNQKAAQPLVNALAESENLIKAFAQRLQQAMQKQQQAQQQNGDGGKTASAIIGAKTKAKIKEAEAKQKMDHSNKKFQQDLIHNAVRTKAEVAAKDLQTAAEIRRKRLVDESEDAGGMAE